METQKLIDLRKRAEKAVAEMPDGELKVKAFEVILTHLLGGGETSQERSREEVPPPTGKSKPKKEGVSAQSITGRILVLKDEGFFKAQKTIGEVREELKAHGWHYPLTTLSGRMQALVQQRRLRRERATQGNKKIWKYSNP